MLRQGVGIAFSAKGNDKAGESDKQKPQNDLSRHQDGRGCGNARRARVGGGFAVFAVLELRI